MNSDERTIDEALNEFGEHASTVIRMTLSDADHFIEQIQSSLLANKIEEMVIQAHSLKSILKAIGALSTAELAREVEFSGKEKNMEKVKLVVPRLVIDYRELKTYLHSKSKT